MKLVAEVAFIRPILIVLLVFYHAFLIYGGGWTQPIGYVDIPIYKDIAVLSYSSMLETFVFISGYLFFWGIIKAKKTYNLWSILKSKFNRLLIPAWVWSILYYFVVDNSNSLKQIVLSGGAIGHMWFLPMLFWCFVFGWLFLKIPSAPNTKLILSLMLSIFSRLPLPFHLSEALYYQFFFVVSYRLVINREQVMRHITSYRIAGIWLVNIIILSLYLVYGDKINSIPHETIYGKIFYFSIKNLQRIIVSSVGVVTLYITALFYISKRELCKNIIKIGSCCFGIYIFQQFILKILYYQTCFPYVVGPYWLPWVSALITLIISLLLTIFLRRYKFFRAIL